MTIRVTSWGWERWVVRPNLTPASVGHVRTHPMPLISHRARLALEILADAGQRGSTDPSFLARFTRELLDLVHDGFASVEREVVKVRCYPAEVARVTITDAGLQALEGPSALTLH